MNAAAIALAAALAAAPNAGASDGAKALQLKPKAAMSGLAPPIHGYAPFVAPSTDPDLDLLPRRDARLDASRSSCTSQRSVCYDPASGRIVYKPVRAFMPSIPGMRSENISVRRDRITLRYTFK